MIDHGRARFRAAQSSSELDLRAAVGKMRLWRRLESMNGHTRSPNIARRQTKSRCYYAACVKINNNVGSVLVRWSVAIRLTSSGGISCFSRSAAKSAREGRSRRRRLHAIPPPPPPRIENGIPFRKTFRYRTTFGDFENIGTNWTVSGFWEILEITRKRDKTSRWKVK